MKRFWLACFALAFYTHAWADNTNDPYEPYNRAVFQFNEQVDYYVMTPVAKTYRKITPRPIKSAVRHFFDNLRDVHSFGANVLRGDIEKAGTDFMRVALNTTFGLGGLINFADAAQMPNNKNTLGDTFATWGWTDSNYFVLPFLGPSTVRDGIGSGISAVYTPEALIHENTVRYGLSVLNATDKRESLLDVSESLNQMALDKYTAMRDVYIAMRNQEIGILPETSQEELLDPEALLDNAASEPVSGSLKEESSKSATHSEKIPEEKAVLP